MPGSPARAALARAGVVATKNPSLGWECLRESRAGYFKYLRRSSSTVIGPLRTLTASLPARVAVDLM